MIKEYANPLRKSFDNRMKEEFPQFSLKKGKGEFVSPGDRLYQYQVADNLVLHILLGVRADHDDFTMEIANTENDVFPLYTPFYEPYKSPIKQNLSFRLAYLWNDCDPLWVIMSFKEERERMVSHGSAPLPPEEVQQRIDVHIEDVMSKLHQYAVPWFEKVAAEFGYTVKLS